MNPASTNTPADLWETFGEEVKALGPWLFGQPGIPQDDAQVQSDGYRYLATLLYVGLDIHVLNADPDRPQWTATFTEYARYGGDQTDGVYGAAPVDPDGTYRITGRAQGGLPVTATIQTMSGWWTPGQPNKAVKTQNVFEFDLEPDGSFELILGGPPREGNYMPLSKDISYLMARQYIADDSRQKLYALSIERIDRPISVPKEYDNPDELSRKLTNAVGFVKELASSYLHLSQGSLKIKNNLVPLPESEKAALGASQEDNYYVGSWDHLKDDEALLIEITPCEAEYWSVAAHNFFYQGLPHADIPEEINMAQAHADADGKVRIVVSPTDPGYYNWISTGGLDIGFLAARWNLRRGQETMVTTKVQLSDLPDRIPHDSRVLSAAEREAQLTAKRDRVLRRYGR